jgi:antitoxin component YwqK of YwqJK toxin-antitoxin module
MEASTNLYYANSTVKYQGQLSQTSLPIGPNAKFFYPDSTLAFQGDFDSNGQPITGQWYHPNGKLFYKGQFSGNGYSGCPKTDFEGNSSEFEVYNDHGVVVFKGILQCGLGDSPEEDIFFKMPQFCPQKMLSENSESMIPKNGNILTKIYHENDKLEYEGFYMSGFRSGVGKCYFENGALRYSGDFKADQPHGQGTLYHEHPKNTPRCSGSFANGQIHGSDTKIFHENGVLKYHGQMHHGVSQGMGTWFFENGNTKYSGKFVSDLPDGANCKIYTGEGTLEYEGQVKIGERDGYGILYYHHTGNRCYEGYWYSGKMDSLTHTTYKNKLYYKTGELMYSGGYRQGLKHGSGTVYHQNGTTRYSGQYTQGEPSGPNITFYHPWKGSKFSGSVKNQQDYDWCKRYSDNGKLILRGFFDQNKILGDGEDLTQDTTEKKLRFGTQVVEYYDHGGLKRVCDIFYNKKGEVVDFFELEKELKEFEAKKERERFMEMISKKEGGEGGVEGGKFDFMAALGGGGGEEGEDSADDADVDEKMLCEDGG